MRAGPSALPLTLHHPAPLPADGPWVLALPRGTPARPRVVSTRIYLWPWSEGNVTKLEQRWSQEQSQDPRHGVPLRFWPPNTPRLPGLEQNAPAASEVLLFGRLIHLGSHGLAWKSGDAFSVCLQYRPVPALLSFQRTRVAAPCGEQHLLFTDDPGGLRKHQASPRDGCHLWAQSRDPVARSSYLSNASCSCFSLITSEEVSASRERRPSLPLRKGPLQRGNKETPK